MLLEERRCNIPTYCYKCNKCGAKAEKFSSIDKRPKTIPCSKCEIDMERDLAAEQSCGVLDSQMHEYNMDGHWGCRPYAASYLLNDKQRAHREHPGTDFKEVNGCYMPVIKHKTHYKKYLKEMNFIEKN